MDMVSRFCMAEEQVLATRAGILGIARACLQLLAHHRLLDLEKDSISFYSSLRLHVEI